MIMRRRVPFLASVILPWLIGILLLITQEDLFAGSGAAMPTSETYTSVEAGTNASQADLTKNANALAADSKEHKQKAENIQNSPAPSPAALARADDEERQARLLANQAQVLRDQVRASEGPESQFLQNANSTVSSFPISPINFSTSDSLSGFMDNLNVFSSSPSDAPGYVPSFDYAAASPAAAGNSWDVPVVSAAHMQIQPAYDVPFQQETMLAQQIENQWQQYSPYVPPQASAQNNQASAPETSIVPQKEPPVVAAVTQVRPESISMPQESAEPISVGYAAVAVEPKVVPVTVVAQAESVPPVAQSQTVVASAPADAPIGSSRVSAVESNTEDIPLPQPPLVLPRTEPAMSVMSMPLEQSVSPQGMPMNIFFYNNQLNAKALQEYYASLDSGYRIRTPERIVVDNGVRFLPVNYLSSHEVELRIYNDILDYTADTMVKEITYDGSWKTVASLQLTEDSIRRYLSKLLGVIGEISITKTIFESNEQQAMEVYYLNLYKIGQKDMIMYVHNDQVIGVKLVTREDNITTAPIYIQAQGSIPSILLKDSFAFAAQYQSMVSLVQPVSLFSMQSPIEDSSLAAERLLVPLQKGNDLSLRPVSIELIPLPYLLRYSQAVQAHTLLKGAYFAGDSSLPAKGNSAKSPYSLLYHEKLSSSLDENPMSFRPSILLF